MIKAAALVSEGGSKLQALIDSVFFQEIPDFELTVISSDPEAHAVVRAENAGLPCYIVEEALFPNGASFSLALLNKLRDLDIDLIILSDFWPPLGDGISRLYYGRAIGVRPALVPAFEGVREDKVCGEALRRGLRVTGATSYYADSTGGVGPIIDQRAVEILPEDTPVTLRRRLMEDAEWPLLVDAVKRHCAGKLKLVDGAAVSADASPAEEAAEAEEPDADTEPNG